MTVEQLELTSVLQGLEGKYAANLARLRVAMTFLYFERRATDSRAYVTTDDARQWLVAHPSWDTPSNRNWLGQLFLDGSWEIVPGDYYSRTKGSHRNRLRRWRRV